jgi:hypothetical protein
MENVFLENCKRISDFRKKKKHNGLGPLGG